MVHLSIHLHVYGMNSSPPVLLPCPLSSIPHGRVTWRKGRRRENSVLNLKIAILRKKNFVGSPSMSWVNQQTKKQLDPTTSHTIKIEHRVYELPMTLIVCYCMKHVKIYKVR